MRLASFVLISLCLIIAIPCVEHPASHERQVGGTFIGAVIGADGIILGSDSRSTFIEADGRPIGYVDGMQKVYVGAGTAVAVSGLTSVEGELFSSFVDRNSFLLERPVDEILFGFSAWLPFKNSTNVLLLSAGFREGKPLICARTVSHPQGCQDTGFITNKKSASLEAWGRAQKGAPTTASAATALKQAIQESAASDPTVGGATSLVQLRSGVAPVWLQSPGSNPWKTICDLVRDQRAGRARIVPTASPQELSRYLNSSCPTK